MKSEYAKPLLAFALTTFIISSGGCAQIRARFSSANREKPRTTPSFALANGTFFHRSVTDDDLRLKEPVSFEPVKTLTADDVKDDIAVLLYALDTGYAGRGRVDGAAYQRAVAAYEAIRSDTTTTYSSESFCALVDRVLKTIPDSELVAWLPNKGDCRPRSALSPDKVLRERTRDENHHRPWSISAGKVGRYEIPVVTIRDFAPRDDEHWKGFLDQLSEALAGARGVVLDLRGNRGGDEFMGQRVASKLVGWEMFPPGQTKFQRQSPAAFALLANGAEYRLRKSGAIPPAPATPAPATESASPLPAELVQLLEKFEMAKAGTIPAEVTVPLIEHAPPPDGGPDPRPIFVLIDRQCEGACEATLGYFEGYSAFKTYGQNTAGRLHFGNVGQVFLPHSHVGVQLATEFTQFKDERFIEKLGYPPVIHVPAGTDALEFALNDMKGQLKRRR